MVELATLEFDWLEWDRAAADAIDNDRVFYWIETRRSSSSYAN